MKMKDMKLQIFAAPENEVVATDLEPAISVDFTTRLSSNITELQNLLGIADLEPMSAGTWIKVYKMDQVNTPEQVAEGETIPQADNCGGNTESRQKYCNQPDR